MDLSYRPSRCSDWGCPFLLVSPFLRCCSPRRVGTIAVTSNSTGLYCVESPKTELDNKRRAHGCGPFQLTHREQYVLNASISSDTNKVSTNTNLMRTNTVCASTQNCYYQHVQLDGTNSGGGGPISYSYGSLLYFSHSGTQLPDLKTVLFMSVVITWRTFNRYSIRFSLLVDFGFVVITVFEQYPD